MNIVVPARHSPPFRLDSIARYLILSGIPPQSPPASPSLNFSKKSVVARPGYLLVSLFFSNKVSMENIIASRSLTIERKHFTIEFRENERGRFLRITEEAHGRRNTVIIPSTGLEAFEDALDDVLDASISAA